MGTGQGMVLGTMGLYIMLCTVHTTQGQGQGTGTDGSKPISPPGPVPGNRFLLYPVPFPMLQCEQYIQFLVPVPFPDRMQCE